MCAVLDDNPFLRRLSYKDRLVSGIQIRLDNLQTFYIYIYIHSGAITLCSFTCISPVDRVSQVGARKSLWRLIKTRDFWNSNATIGLPRRRSVRRALPDEWGSKIDQLPATNDSRSLRDLLYCCKWPGRRKQPINGTNTFLFFIYCQTTTMPRIIGHRDTFLFFLSLLLPPRRKATRQALGSTRF